VLGAGDWFDRYDFVLALVNFDCVANALAQKSHGIRVVAGQPAISESNDAGNWKLSVFPSTPHHRGGPNPYLISFRGSESLSDSLRPQANEPRKP
jgi:hypothetical protein